MMIPEYDYTNEDIYSRTKDKDMLLELYKNAENHCTSAMDLIHLSERIFFGLGDTVWAKRVYSKAKSYPDFGR